MSKNDQDISLYHFRDLVDVEAFSLMLEHFYQATHVANGVVGNDGELITKAGWTNACVDFHRQHPKSNQQCIDSNIQLIEMLEIEQHSCGKLCANGMVDYAIPVIVEDFKIASIFLGQILHEEPDIGAFRKQAQRFGYNEEKYIAAIKAVPVIEKSEIDALLVCLVDIAKMLVESGLARLRQEHLERDLTIHKAREIQLEDILEFSPVAISWSNKETGQIEYINRAFEQLFGYSYEDIPDVETWFRKAYPNPEQRKESFNKWNDAGSKANNGSHGMAPFKVETTARCKDGSIRNVQSGFAWIGQHCLSSFTDTTKHWLAERRLDAHRNMLEMVAKGAPLAEILYAIVTQVEKEANDSVCSVLLMSEDGKHLLYGCAPSLPDDYNQAIHGVEIGLNVGSCGTAAYLAERVVVENISTHPYWADYSELAASANLAACWSDPIISSTGKVLGTFAIYHSYPATPTDKDFELIGFASSLASIAIENRKVQQELERRAYYDYLTELPNRRHFFELAEQALDDAKLNKTSAAILMMDVDHFKVINDCHGHKTGDQVLRDLSKKCQEILGHLGYIGRIGGEEFALLLPNTERNKAVQLAEQIRQELSEMRIQTAKGEELSFTVSFGISQYDCKSVELTLDRLLSRADKALYRAKNNGRNCVYVDEVE